MKAKMIRPAPFFKRILLLSLVLTMVTLLVGIGGTAASETEKTYIEFILDSSFSMNEQAERNKTRMDVAKEVMIDLIQNLEDRPDLEIGLRVYGARNTQCDDTVLMQDFTPVAEARAKIIEIVRSLRPRGKTPIAYSLELAALDFPSKDSRNVIVLITDGEESCGGNPCLVSAALQAEGIIYKPYVVGFAMTASEEAKVRCIGTYYSAKDRKSLSEALGSIMKEVVQEPEVRPANLQVKVTYRDSDITADCRLEVIRDTTTAAVFDVGNQVFRYSGDAGTVDLKVTYLGAVPVEKSVAGIRLEQGQTTSVTVKLDDLLGTLRVRVLSGNRDVTAQAEAWARDDQRQLPLASRGDFLTAVIPSGFYGVQAVYQGNRSQLAEVDVSPGETTDLTLTIDAPAKIVLVPTFDGEPVPTDKVRAWYIDSTGVEAGFADENGKLTAVVKGGVYGIRCEYLGTPPQVRRLDKVEVAGGEVKQIPVPFAAEGKLRVIVTADGKPHVAGQPLVTVYKAGAGFDSEAWVANLEMVAQGVCERQLRYGKYDLRIIQLGAGYPDEERFDIEIVGGEVTETIIEVGAAGKLQIRLSSDGRPHTAGSPLVIVYEAGAGFDPDAWVANFEQVAQAVHEGALKAGTYDIKVINLGDGFRDQELLGIEVKSGAITQKTIELGGLGRVEVDLTGAEGYDWLRVMLFAVGEFSQWGEYDTYVCDLEYDDAKGIWRGEVREGKYQMRITDGYGREQRLEITVEPGTVTRRGIVLDLREDWETYEEWGDSADWEWEWRIED